MSRRDEDLDQLLDRTVAEIRDDLLSVESEKAIAGRVWQRVRDEVASHPRQAEERISDCSDFQGLIPAYLQGALSEAKLLLLEDHVGECLPCRKAMKQARSARRGVKTAAASRSPVARSWAATLGWRVAAVAAILLAVVGLSHETDLFTIQAGGLVHIEDIDGELFQVTEDGSVPLSVGDQVSLGQGEALRTAKGSRAMLRLADDSRVEMDSRADLAVYERRPVWQRGRGDTVIALERGNVIVEATEQGSGHLFVDTADCEVAVKGTVFSVRHGIKGSRISVIEGEVEVDYERNQDLLGPGQQLTTKPGLSRVPLEQDIAWSANAQQHLALLREVTALGREIDRVITPGLRYSTALLDAAPENTAIYIGIPNVSESLAQAYDVVLERVGSSEALRDWWEQNMTSTGADQDFREAIDKIRAYGDHLGEEIAVTLLADGDGDVDGPLVLARLENPVAFRKFVEEELDLLAETDPGAAARIGIFEGLTARMVRGQPGSSGQFNFWIRDDLLALTEKPEQIVRFSDALASRAHQAPSGLLTQMADHYRDGVEWIVGVDMGTLVNEGVGSHEEASMRGLGLLDMQHLIVERKATDEMTESRAVLTFDQDRRGIAAWLDEPAPMGSLDFISANPHLVGAFVVCEPAALVDELFGVLIRYG